MPDFATFYTAGKILQRGDATHLYDAKVQHAIQEEFIPISVSKRGTMLPYIHPPFEALLFLPLAGFSYAMAYLIWLAINLALLFSIPYWLFHFFPALNAMPRYVWFFAIFGFFPIFRALQQGQDTILLLVFYCAAYATMRQGKDVYAGGLLGLGLLKFHLVLPFAAALIFSHRKRFFAGFLPVAFILGVISVGLAGASGVLAYPKFVWEMEHSKSYAWVNLSNTLNLRGLLYEMLPAGSRLQAIALTVLSVGILGAASWFWRQTDDLGPGEDRARFPLDLAFAVSVIATVLVSYHTFVHDWTILLLPIFLLSEMLLSGRSLSPRVRFPVGVCLFAMFFSPMYLLCAFRFQRLEVVAYPLLFLFLLLVLSSVSPPTHKRQVSFSGPPRFGP